MGKKTAGRPSRRDEWVKGDGLIKIQGWARAGLTDKQIAKNIGVSEVTLCKWKNDCPEFYAALQKSKEVVDYEVENALLKRALGYEYDEVQVKKKGDVVIERTITRKQVPPDTTAQIFWLKNRQPEKWRDRKNIDLTGNVNNPFEGMTTDELKKLIKDD